MFIDNVPYTCMKEDMLSSTAACLHMFLRFHQIPIDPYEVSDIFSTIFMSRKFNEWYTHSLDMDKYEENAMLSCAQYMIRDRYPDIKAGVVMSTIEKIRWSYTKRKIPVLLTGRFPLSSGKVANTVIVKGYVDDYLIVNDPRGNANTGYLDKCGENILYSCEHLNEWSASEGRVHILRGIP